MLAAFSQTIQTIFSSISQDCIRYNIAEEIFAPVYDSSNSHKVSITSFFSMLGQTMKWIVKLRNEWWQLVLVHMWPDLRKAGFHAHNSKTHFSPSNNSRTRWLTIQPGIDAESWPGCFCCGLFLSDIHECTGRLQMAAYISPWQADSCL